MKTKLALLAALLALFISCSNEKSDAGTQATQESTAVAQTETTENKENVQTETVVEKKDIAEVEDFSDFQDKILKEYADLELTSFEVSKYAKGIELLFMTTNKDFSKDKFNEMAKHCVEEFKDTYTMDKSIEKIPVTISYKKDDNSNAVFLYEY